LPALDDVPDSTPNRGRYLRLVRAIDWAWERAEEEAAGRHPETFVSPRMRLLKTFLLKFRLATEGERIRARRAGLTRAEFREALARLVGDGFETRGRPPGRERPAVALLGFIDEVAALPVIERLPASVVGCDRLTAIVENVERDVAPLVVSWERFLPYWALLAPEDVITDDADPTFPALKAHTIRAALTNTLDRQYRRRAAPVRIAEAIGARLFNMSVSMAKERIQPSAQARCALARRAWRGDPIDL